MTQGTRKLLVTLAALLVGAFLAWFGRLDAHGVELLVWLVGGFVAGNTLEHVARAFGRPEASK